MNSDGKGKGRGKGKGSQRLKGKGKGERTNLNDGPIEKVKPTFSKLKDIYPSGESFDVIVKVGAVSEQTTREERRAGRTYTSVCKEATVGDETGSIQLVVKQLEKADLLVVGARIALINVKMRKLQSSLWLEVDNWSAVKALEDCVDLLPENFDGNFELNTEVDRSKKIPPRPTFHEIDALEPEMRGLNLICKVLEIEVKQKERVDGTVSRIAEATVGDLKGCITLVIRGLQLDLLEKGKVVVIMNAHIEMLKGFMRLIADRWTDLKPLESFGKDLLPILHVTPETVVDEKNNKSKVEWMLVDE